MEIYELGEGTPEVAVVGSIHGDEPCGARAIERLVAEEPDVDRPVKLIVANEEALAQTTRYLDDDLNRTFPGDRESDSHEQRLAYHLAQEIRGCTTFSLHSTQSYDEPFALVDAVDAVARSVTPHLPIDYLVETEKYTEGRLIAYPHTIEVECGLQGSDEAAENAYWLVRGFLAATGVLPAPMAEEPLDAGDRETVSVFSLEDHIPKEPGHQYEVFATNFELVEKGERFAAIDGEGFYAEQDFYPILMSPYGYEDVFGYTGEHVGELE